MKCCMPFCDISSESFLSNSELKLKAITFHGFPRAPQIRESWLANLCIEECELPEDAVICSQHFKKDDFYCIKSGLRKLRIGAVPIETPFTQIDVQVCMICLDTGCKLYPMSKYHLGTAYTKLTGISMIHRLNKAPKLCTECNQRLMNYANFRDKSLRAYKLLLHLVKKHGHLTIQNVKELNRVENKLTSDLVKHINEPNYCGPNAVNKLKDKIKQENSSDVKNSDEALSEEEDEKDARGENSTEITDTAFTYGFSDAIENSEKYVMLKYLAKHDDDNDIESNNITKNYKSIASDMKNTNSYYDMSNDVDTKNDMFIARDEVNLKDEIYNDVKTDCDDDNNLSIERNVVNPSYEISDDIKISNAEFNDNNDDYYEVECLNNCFEDEIQYLRDANIEDDIDALNAKIKDVDEKKRIRNNKKIGNNKQIKNNKIGINKKIRNIKQITNDKKSNGTNRAKGTKTVPKVRRKPDVVHLKLFKKTTMSQEDAAAKQLSRKETKNYKASPFKCDKCYRGFNNEKSYGLHMDKHTDKAGPLECDVCKIHETTRRKLRIHIRSSHMFKYSCTLCPFVNTAKSAAVPHERWHEGAKYTCEHCGTEFSKHSTYTSHLRSRHPADVVCGHCGFAFTNEKGLAFHMQMTHPSLDPTQKLEGPLCEQCDVHFASEKAYKQHLEVSSKHVLPGTSICNSAALIEKRQAAAQRKHNRNTIVCEECGERITGYHNYCHHLRVRHDDKRRERALENAQRRAAPVPMRIMCEVCGKLFTCQARLNDHMPSHSGQKPFECDVCGKGYMHRESLITHKATHAEDKPRYTCELCGKQFAYKPNRRRHERVAHRSVTYKCEVCDKTFTSDRARRDHVKHVHNGVPRPKKIRTSRHAKASRPETQARLGDTDNDSRLQTRVRRGDTNNDSRPLKRARYRDTSSDSDSDAETQTVTEGLGHL